MSLVEDERTGGFAFTWSIYNFSYCAQKKNELLDSPKFVAALIGNTTWYLRLFPKGNNASGFISYYLQRDGSSAEIVVSPIVSVVNFVLSIRDSNGLLKKISERSLNPNSKSFEGYKKFLSLDELKRSDTYLDNDTLTLCCRMWKNDADLSASVQCFAHTKIKVTKLNYMWALKYIEDSNYIIETLTAKIQRFSTEIPCFTIHLMYGGPFGDDIIHFAIEQAIETDRLFLTCMIHLLGADGRVAHSVRGEYLFEKSNGKQTWTIPFLSRHTLLAKEKVYFPDGNLFLRCEFSASTGAENSAVEKFDYGTIDDLQLKTVTHAQVSDLPGSWKENMQRFYNDGKFSNLTVCTPNRQFPVHIAILCAQSEVFSTMLESDMKENQTSVVEIEDLEDDIVSKMLMFLYTNTLEDIDFSMAYKLYFAADKYRITALHRKCSTYLIQSLDTSNVCDVLVLADTHQDQELKSIARDFIFAHAYEIMNSDDWKKLIETKAHLTSETMQLMICKNLQFTIRHLFVENA